MNDTNSKVKDKRLKEKTPFLFSSHFPFYHFSYNRKNGLLHEMLMLHVM